MSLERMAELVDALHELRGADNRPPNGALWWDDPHTCSVCGRQPDRIETDHCHHTGLVRGWLCHPCNIREGHGDASPVWFLWRLTAPRLADRVRYITNIGDPPRDGGMFLNDTERATLTIPEAVTESAYRQAYHAAHWAGNPAASFT